ncbi:MAG: phosphatase PAP2-related protein [Bacteroidia bacterium]
MRTTTNNWSQAFRDTHFRSVFFRDVILLLVVLIALFITLAYAETRVGFVIERGWLNVFISPIDLSVPIFIITYLATVGGVFLCIQKPEELLRLIRLYLLIQGIRIFTLLLLPLEAPEGIVPLNDPILQNTFYAGRPNLKDLFFSGHTATILMYGLVADVAWRRWIFALLAAAAGILLAVQRVHYMLDVIAAPVFVVLCFWLVTKWEKSKFH